MPRDLEELIARACLSDNARRADPDALWPTERARAWRVIAALPVYGGGRQADEAIMRARAVQAWVDGPAAEDIARGDMERIATHVEATGNALQALIEAVERLSAEKAALMHRIGRDAA